MKSIIHPPLAIHDQGRRENNEDCIYPPLNSNIGSKENRLFIVCDGVGGLDKGEMASKIVCDTLSDCLRHNSSFEIENIQSAIRLAEQRIDEYISKRKQGGGMATTLTLLAIQDDKTIIAHIGDSRVYHIREGKCLFKTFDHSLVNDLLDKKIITPEEARNHPQKNVITRAITGSNDSQRADIKIVDNLKPEDYFLLCTDGILESFSDDEILELISSNISNTQKIEKIKSRCKEFSKDNYSAYLIQIKRQERNSSLVVFNKWLQDNLSLASNLMIAILAIFSGIALLIFLNSGKEATPIESETNEVNAYLDSIGEIKEADSVFMDQAIFEFDPSLKSIEDEMAEDNIGNRRNRDSGFLKRKQEKNVRDSIRENKTKGN